MTKKTAAPAGPTTKKYLVELKHASNPDVDGGYWTPPADSGKAQRVGADSLEEASRICRAYMDRNELGGGNWNGGNVYENGKLVAEVSYNGRVWEPRTRRPGTTPLWEPKAWKQEAL